MEKVFRGVTRKKQALSREECEEVLRTALRGVLANDPRPRYQDDPARVYGLRFAGKNVRFRVEGDVLTVVAVEP